MAQFYLIDTGPLVASINRRDQWHEWALHELGLIPPPLLTCEAVISEAHFLLAQVHGGRDALMGMLADQLIQVPWQLTEELSPVRELLRKYQSVPMSLAEACLVRMAEQYAESTIVTIDSDFRIYRMNRNQAIPVIIPEGM
jgi:predicted nucleic acid-binding protein